MDLGLENYRIEKECNAVVGGAPIWDPHLPSGLNERRILEKQRPFWEFLEKGIITAKMRFHLNEPEQ